MSTQYSIIMIMAAREGERETEGFGREFFAVESSVCETGLTGTLILRCDMPAFPWRVT